MKRRFVVRGPHYSDKWWFVDDTAAAIRENHRKWFKTRREAREYAKNQNDRRPRFGGSSR